MIARVAFPIAVPGLYDYHVPAGFRQYMAPGIPVRVPLRNRVVWGVVVSLAQRSEFPDLKDIVEVKTTHWTDTDRSLIRLYEWMAGYYHCGLGRIFRPLVRKGVVDMHPKTKTVFMSTGAAFDAGLTKKQAEAAMRLRSIDTPKTKDQLREQFGVSGHMVSALVKKGVLSQSQEQVVRRPGEILQEAFEENVTLTAEQRCAVERIGAFLGKPSKPFLLYGITGSGKTHVYIELARACLQRGAGVIILVPEISLTPQTIQRFRGALGDVIAVVHSRMSDGERRDSMEELVSGRKRVAIGVRSVVLAPMENVGLIVVDEEHDHSYKQDDCDPRYHARDVAVMRGRYQNAVVVLGSATPSFESYYNALSGKYEMIKLRQRFGIAALPTVEIVDMNMEHRRGNWTILSAFLRRRMEDTLAGGRQIILLLNRRGFSVTLICKNCGTTYTCPNCSVHLVYHRVDSLLKCHQCGYSEPAPTVCPTCRGEQIKYAGTGIQKAEEYLREAFPAARIMRMDQDSTRGKGRHVSILGAFARHEADILLGTQMVAKGLNFPGVKLVGVLQADIGLHFPDFRASEKTFQLLTQVAGRAGRKDNLGEVVVQTYMPREPGIVAAQRHDFEGFYEKEIDARRTLGYPPFGKLVRIIVLGEAETVVRGYARSVSQAIEKAGKGHLTVLGPAPSVLARINKVYRYSMLIKSQSPTVLQSVMQRVHRGTQSLPSGVKLIIDVDPLDML